MSECLRAEPFDAFVRRVAPDNADLILAEVERLREEREGFMEQMNRMELETQHWIRLFNRLDAAISHHKAGERFPDDHDERLWAARDRVLKAAAEGRS